METPTDIYSENTNLTIIPYASEIELEEYMIDNSIIDYRLSRKAALSDLTSFRDIFDFSDQDITISNLPVIIKENGNPKLYELIVYKNGNPVGTVVSFATKEVPDFTAAILPFIRNYSSPNSLEYSAYYPNTPSEITTLKSSYPQSNKSDNSLSEEDNFEIKKFWKEVEKHKDELLANSDLNIIESGSSLRSTEFYTIPEFNDEKLHRTRFTGWCGPAAMAWVYRGLYSTFNGKFIPLHGENTHYSPYLYLNRETNSSFYTDKHPLYKEIEKRSGTLSGLINGATLPDDFDRTVSQIFPDRKIERHKGTIKGAPRRAIERGNPVYLVVFTSDPSMHYIIVFGTKDKFGWFGFHSDSWLLVTDNGATTEHHGYLPYYRNSHFFNFGNKYTHMGEFVKSR